MEFLLFIILSFYLCCSHKYSFVKTHITIDIIKFIFAFKLTTMKRLETDFNYCFSITKEMATEISKLLNITSKWHTELTASNQTDLHAKSETPI